ncbi:4-coumarate:coenzyme A ligase [Bisporella sp. PMI_857]|nr:4-coumarate:coenzyme A ligase [Bisporella sp. PMI_857]
MLHLSPEPSIEVPTGQPLWSWLFDSYSAATHSTHATLGFYDAESGKGASYNDCKAYSTYLSTALSRYYNVTEGDRIMLFTHNSVWYPVVMFAGFRIATIVSGASPSCTLQEMKNALKIATPKLIIVDRTSFPTACKAAEDLSIPKEQIVFIDRIPGGHQNIPDLIDRGKALGQSQVPEWALRKGQTTADVCALLCFSSGTTGLPKAVMISHENIISQCCQMKSLRRKGLSTSLISPLPLFHITGLIQIMTLPVHIGQNVILMKKFNMKNMLEAIVKYQAGELWLVPPILIRLVNEPRVKQYNLDHITQFNTGAAPLAPEIIQRLAAAFPSAGIKQGWGMTESTSCITSTPPRFLSPRFAHTVGVAVPNTVLKVVDPASGEELGVDTPGEIWAKGPQISMGYFSNEAATKESFGADGYLRTGDLGSINKDGLVTIHDRIKEMIKVRGTAVAPAELEDILLGHPAVQDAAVIGIKDDYSGELPRAYVVVAPGTPADAQTAIRLQHFVKKACTRAKWLDGGIDFVDVIPKSPAGKILRKVLRERANQERKQKAQLSKI